MKKVTSLLLIIFSMSSFCVGQAPIFIYETTADGNNFDIEFLDNRTDGNPKQSLLYNDLDSTDAINYYLREEERAQDNIATTAVDAIILERQAADVIKELNQNFSINANDYLAWANNRNNRRLDGFHNYRVQGVLSANVIIDSLEIYRQSDTLQVGRFVWQSPRRIEVILFQTNDTLFLNKSTSNNFWFGRDQQAELHILKPSDTPDDPFVPLDTQGSIFVDPNAILRL